MAAFKFDFGGDSSAPASSAEASPAPAGVLRPITRVPLMEEGVALGREDTRFCVAVGGDDFELLTSRSTKVVEAGVYEGGAELWECALDLASYLEAGDVDRWRGGSALELGCGRGLPGLWALRRGARRVVFTDYDAGVLETLTRRDVRRELERRAAAGGAAAEVSLYAGDWSGLPSALAEDTPDVPRFDLILSAETAYRDDTATSLVDAIVAHLAPNGVALVATKRYYFGCGGGTVALQTALARTSLAHAVVWSADDGKSNIRDILELKWRDAPSGGS